MGNFCFCFKKHDSVAKNMVLDLPVDPNVKNKRPDNYVRTYRYTLVNFFPKCGLEQFRNLSNVYFLVIVILAILGTNTNLFESPYSAAGTLLGLVLVISFTMAFEGYYDIKRHREDHEVNSRTAYRLRPGDGHVEEIKWSQVQAGDVLKVQDRQQFPADLLFVTSCAVGHKCYVETANIDGETNLKIKHVPKNLVDRCILPDQVASLKSRIEYDSPSPFLSFSGTMRVYDDKYVRERSPDGYIDVPLETANILLRGSVLRNTPWVLGIVLYAGPETKVVQSSSNPPTKMSRIQKLVNRIIGFILVVDLILCTVSSLIAIFGFPSDTEFYYLKQDQENTFLLPAYIANVCTFIVLYSSLLPIALLFCMTFANFFQAMFVHWDVDMYHEETDTPAKCNTMQLVQELGQVSYLFSDKTGTLTRNEMKLVGCTVNGSVYGIGNADKEVGTSSDNSIREIFSDVIHGLENGSSAEQEKLLNFFMILAVCHTVLVDTTTGCIQYNAEGPDEEALVSAAAEIGVRLVATDNGRYVVCVDTSDELAEQSARQRLSSVEKNAFKKNKDRGDGDGESDSDEDDDNEEDMFKDKPKLEFEILAINHFNSTRKRMSVVCKTPEGKLMLLVKGADTIMFDLIGKDVSPEEAAYHRSLASHLDAFANDGLRTLVMASKEIDQESFEIWKQKYDAACNALGDQRATLLAQAAETIEKDLRIVGASAIEDRLQDGVPETLVALKEAGVKTWVLTGDKVETAINIAFSARLFSPEMELIQITDPDPEVNLQTLRQLQDLLVPKNLAKDSEKRKRGREAVKEASSRLIQDGTASTIQTLGKAVHGVTNTVEKAGRATFDIVEKGATAAFNVVTLKQFRSPTEESHSCESFSSQDSTNDVDVVIEGSSENAGTEEGEYEEDEEAGNVQVAKRKSTESVSTVATIEDDVGGNVDQQNAKGKKKKRNSFHFSKLWSNVTLPLSSSSSFGASKQQKSSSIPATAPTHEWQSNQATVLPPGAEGGETQAVNERELVGNEKNLDEYTATNMALVVSGAALANLLKEEHGNEETQKLLLSIAKLCSVVVACRVSPKQKALVVRMVKRGVKMQDGSSPITLAIGDGANDVAMIQEARVGVGISGHEGRQAVNSSDFAVAQFRFLQQLMLVHGRWNYRRAASMVLFVFYSNILLIGCNFAFNFYNKFSGTALYFVFLTTIYAYPFNIPICMIACLNKDISRKTALEYPAMYISGRRNLHLDRASAFEYIFRSFLHCFFICAFCIVWAAPLDIDMAVIGTTVFVACVYVSVARSCLETYTWTWINFVAIAFGFGFLLVFEPVYYSADPTIYLRYGPTIMFAEGSAPYLWKSVFLVMMVCVCYDMFVVYIRKEFNPNLVDVVIEIDRGYGGDTAKKKSRLRKVNKVFRKLAQPLTIPATAISELLAASNISNISRAGHRSAFDYDHPEDERVRQIVMSLLNFNQVASSVKHLSDLVGKVESDGSATQDKDEGQKNPGTNGTSMTVLMTEIEMTPTSHHNEDDSSNEIDAPPNPNPQAGTAQVLPQ